MEVASDKKGNDIVLLRTAELTTMADFFVILSGRSDRQVQALAGAIVDELRDAGIRPMGVEGKGVRALGAAGLRSVIVQSSRPRSASTTASSGCGEGRQGRARRWTWRPTRKYGRAPRGDPSVPLRLPDSHAPRHDRPGATFATDRDLPLLRRGC